MSEQHYVLIFITHLWSFGTALTLDTQNPKIPGFIICAIQYQTTSKNEAKTEKNTISLVSHQSTFVPENHKRAKKI